MNSIQQSHWFDAKCCELTELKIAIRMIRTNHAAFGISESELLKVIQTLNEREMELQAELSAALKAFTSHFMLEDLLAVLASETAEAQVMMKEGQLFAEENKGFLESYVQRLLRMHLYLSNKECETTDAGDEQKVAVSREV